MSSSACSASMSRSLRTMPTEIYEVQRGAAEHLRARPDAPLQRRGGVHHRRPVRQSALARGHRGRPDHGDQGAAGVPPGQGS